jgi:hypothetical protein
MGKKKVNDNDGQTDRVEQQIASTPTVFSSFPRSAISKEYSLKTDFCEMRKSLQKLALILNVKVLQKRDTHV